MNLPFDSLKQIFQNYPINHCVAYLAFENKLFPFFFYPENSLSSINLDKSSLSKVFQIEINADAIIKTHYQLEQELDESLFLVLNNLIKSLYLNVENELLHFIQQLNNEFNLKHLSKESLLENLIKKISQFFKPEFACIKLERQNKVDYFLCMDSENELIPSDTFTELLSTSNFKNIHLYSDRILNKRVFVDVFYTAFDFLPNFFSVNKNFQELLQKSLENIFQNYFKFSDQSEYLTNLESIVNDARKELELKNLKLLSQLNKITYIEKSRDILFTNIYHQLITPLNSIIGFSRILQDDLQKKEMEDLNTYIVDPIISNSLFLLNMILIIIDYSQLFSEKLPFHPQEFSIANLSDDINEMILLFQNLENCTITFINSFTEGIVKFDFKKLEQLLFSQIYFLIHSKIKEFTINFDKDNNDFIIKFNFQNEFFSEEKKIEFDKIYNQAVFINQDDSIHRFLHLTMLELFNKLQMNFHLETFENNVIISYVFAEIILKD